MLAFRTKRRSIRTPGHHPRVLVGGALTLTVAVTLSACGPSQSKHNEATSTPKRQQLTSWRNQTSPPPPGAPDESPPPAADSIIRQHPCVQLPDGWRARVQQNGKWGIIGEDRQWILKPAYDYIGPYQQAMAFVRDSSKMGYVDTTGQLVLTLEAADPSELSAAVLPDQVFRHHRAVLATTGHKYGFINPRGEIAIPPAYDFAWGFNAEGLALVKLDNRLGLIDTSGQYVIPPKVESMNPANPGGFRSGLEPVQMDGEWGYVQRSGRLAIQPRFKEAEPFYEYYAAVKLNNHYAYIDTTGRVITWLNFSAVRPFSEGKAAVRLLGDWRYIDTTGKVVVFQRFERAGNFHDSLAAVRQDGRWGLIGHDGYFRAPPVYDSILHPFAPGLIAVRQDSRWGFLDERGQRLIRPQFDQVRAYASGPAAVHRKWQGWGFIGRQGRYLTPLMFDDVRGFDDATAPAQLDGQWGFIDRQGHWLIRPQYDAVSGSEVVAPSPAKPSAAP